MRHNTDQDWLCTPTGDPRGYIQPHALRELWFHTGTKCNLACPFCLEGSNPTATRLGDITLDEARPFIDEALTMGVEQFSFTGGEPFVNKHMVPILAYALEHRPCLVLTNGSKPIRNRIDDIARLRLLPHPLRFRVSLDSPDPKIHDAGRGEGQFAMALESLRLLREMGFEVSIARLSQPDEDAAAIMATFTGHFREAGLPEDTNIVVFPDFHLPGSHVDVPHITENCMTTYKTEETRRAFMCAYSKMIVKKNGRLRVYACTLVDDDEDYDLGRSLAEAMPVRVMLRHHRCFSCFSCGASCSEPSPVSASSTESA